MGWQYIRVKDREKKTFEPQSADTSGHISKIKQKFGTIDWKKKKEKYDEGVHLSTVKQKKFYY